MRAIRDRVPEILIATLFLGLAIEFWLAPRHANSSVPTTPLAKLQAALQGTFHDCVPLGWYPKRLPGEIYYPGMNLDVANADGPFQSLWVGIVRPGAERDPRIAAIKEVIDRLVDAGILTRTNDLRGIRYNVSRYGQSYYYDGDHINGNTENWKYVCYSTLDIENVSWDSRYRDSPGPWRSVTKHARFAWKARVVADWASPFLRAHSVQLAPTHDPSTAVVRRYVDGEWALLSFLDENPQSRWPVIPETATLKSPQ